MNEDLKSAIESFLNEQRVRRDAAQGGLPMTTSPVKASASAERTTEAEMRVEAEALARKGVLRAGTSYIVENDKTVWSVVVWASGGVWFVRHHRPGDRHYGRAYSQAVRDTSTLWRTEKPHG